MSEMKGRPGWMSESALKSLIYRPGVCERPVGESDIPVWITRLREGEPQPGETWEWRSGRVQRDGTAWGKVCIETPPYDWNGDERAVTVLCEDGDYCVALLSDLRDPPKTRTVTVELTEEEVQELKSPRFFGGSALRKLADALEDG